MTAVVENQKAISIIVGSSKVIQLVLELSFRVIS